jgi:RNA polymerase sigma factor (sigma-70 family)
MSTESLRYWSGLLESLREGDERAWSEVVALVSPLIFSACRKMRLNRDESYDVFGQVCYQLLQNLDKIHSPQKLPGYVATITRREVLARLRRHRRFVNDETVLQALTDMAAEEPTVLHDQLGQSRQLMSALLRLPPRDYQLLTLLFLEPAQPSYEEVARQLQIPVSSIGPTRQRSLAKLRRLMGKQLK